MRCLSCSTDNDEGLKFCTRCGAELGIACPGCGSSNRTTAMFCGHCASPLRPEGRASVPPPPAERRQITVVFCDLVDSTAISERLDAEDWREILRAYQARSADIVRRFDGYVAQYLGDGLLIYFGYPRAHEDGARRAVRAALSIVHAVEGLSPRLEVSRGVKLQVRIGIHTGPVVVGEIGDAGRLEFLAVGDTPNLAARVEGAAEANSVVVSDATYRLTKGYFNFRELGAPSLKGFSYATPLYQVTGDAGVKHPLDVAAGELTPFIGRQRELEFIVDRWKDARDGKAPVVTLCGEPGIGKSRLVRSLRERLDLEGSATLECYGSPFYQGTVLHPVLEMIEGRLGFTRETSAEDKLAKLRVALERAHVQASEALPLLAAVLSIPVDDKTEPVGLSPQKQRQATFDALVAWLHALTVQQPILFVFEDLHWADPSTLEFLGLLIERAPPGPLMLLLTHRPEFSLPWTIARIFRLDLLRMRPEETRRLLRAVLKDTPLPAQIEQEVLAKAEGVPLYVEEIAKAVLESPAQLPAERSSDAAPSSTPLAIPTTVRDSLTARLDRLGAGKAVVQIGAALGRTFSLEVLQAASGMDEGALRAELDRLVASELLFRGDQPSNETYTFKHALIQDAAYASLLRSTRQAYHRQIALVLSERFPGLADAQPEVLAHHFAGAAMAREAIGQWALAGERAIARSAYLEALDAFARALRQLATLPQSKERDRKEVELRSALGFALLSTRGYSSREVEENYARASELCEQFGDLPPGVLYGVWAVHLVRNDLEATARLARLFTSLTETSKDQDVLSVAYSALGVRSFVRGEYGTARLFFETALTHSEFDDAAKREAALQTTHGPASYLYPFLYMAYGDLICGFPQKAFERWKGALNLAEELRNPYAVAMALNFGATMAHDSRKFQQTRDTATRQMAVSLESGFPFWAATSHTLLGWCEACDGRLESGIAKIETGLQTIRMIGAHILYPYDKTCLAEAYLVGGRLDEALAAVDDALSSCEGKLATNHVPVMIKVRGDILASRGDLDGAERQYRESLSTLHQQEARLFELQTGVSLARLLRKTNREREARSLLSSILGFFTEGFDLPDFVTARRILEAPE